jgi:hypothetical protein
VCTHYVYFAPGYPEEGAKREWNRSHSRELLARRGGALGTLEAREPHEQEIETGRGGLYLNLTADQYRNYGPYVVTELMKECNGKAPPLRPEITFQLIHQ